MSNKIDKETAEAEFVAMCETMDVDADLSDLSEEDVNSFNKQKANVVKAIMQGYLVIDDGVPTYHTTGGKTLVIHEVTGGALIAMDTVKAGNDNRKLFKLIQELTKSSIKADELKMRDIRILSALVGLFLAM